ncbi:MAG: NUDIX hydrolase [Actinomycetota bacterium]|nr:NUDIX domain-containing protein [Actinomycetota bacterium]
MTTRYRAAGGVVMDGPLVLVLRRPARNELRLPKGHVDPGESDEEAAVREVAEESGHQAEVIADLGEMEVRFDREGQTTERVEHYFLMESVGEANEPEQHFVPEWVPATEAVESLTFEAEREWVRRAMTTMRRS